MTGANLPTVVSNDNRVVSSVVAAVPAALLEFADETPAATASKFRNPESFGSNLRICSYEIN